MSIATRHDNPSASHHRENSLDGGEETFDLLLHVNCPRCFHMHKHVQLRVHKNPKLFTRFDCQECHHKIAGIGRNDTQSTFASTETQPLEAGYSRPSRPSNLQSCINAGEPNGQPGGVQKAGSTVLSSPSGSKRTESGLPPHQDFHTQASVRNDCSLREASGRTIKPLSKIKLRWILKLKQGRIQLLKKSKNMKLLVFRFWKRETPSPPSGVQTGVDLVPSDLHSDVRDFQHRPLESERSMQPQDNHPSTPPPGPERRSSSVEEQLQAKALRNERLRQQRREATLRRNFYSRPVCQCEANCTCMRQGSVSTGAGTDSRSNSRQLTLQQADAIADGLPPNLLDFTHDTRQLIYPREPLDNNVLDTLAETGTRSHIRLSQATTIRSAGAA